MVKYRTIDLCAGIGGMRRGFELTGRCENILSAEIDEQAARTYEFLFNGDNPRNNLMTADFRKKVMEHPYDILLAGFPCQAFSSAGLKRGFLDKEKGNIFFGIAKIIKESRPKAVFLENVQNLMSHDGGRTIRRILKTLNKLNYRVIGATFDKRGEPEFSRKSFVRNTLDFGLPQNRPRVYIMAFNKEIYGEALDLIDDNEILPLNSDKVIFADVDSLLEDRVPAHYYMASGYLSTLIKHKRRERSKGNGFGYCVVNDPQRNKKIANTLMATGGSGKERNLIYQPVPEYYNLKIPGKHTRINNKGIRIMTPVEWGRLQGFIGYGFIDEMGIDQFEFPEGMRDGQKYKQLGNAVSIPVIKTMADYMIAKLDLLASEKNTLVRVLATHKNEITRHDIIELFRVDGTQATCILRNAVNEGVLKKIGNGRTTKYCINRKDSK